MNEFSENTQFKLNSLEEQMTGNEVNIESFLNIISSVFEERENVLKSADKAVIQNFKDIMKIGGKTEATAATMVSKLSKGARPFTREYAVMFCYAAGYKTEEANNQLQKIFLVDGFHLRNYEDLIDSFFLQNNSLENCVENYTKAYEMKERYKKMYKCAELKVPVENLANENPGQYTEFFEKECAKIETVEQLEIFLSSEDTLNKAGNINRTAKSYMYDVVFELCSRIIDRIADNKNLDDTGNIQKCLDDLGELYDEEDSKKLCELVVKLLNSILNPSVYFDLRGIDSCFNPIYKYYEMSLSGIPERDWPQCALNKKREYLEYQRKSAKIVGFFNANYNNIENGFNKAVKNGRFDKLIEYLSTVNGEDKEHVLKKLHTVYRESMFNVLMYDYWGLRIYLRLPLETSLSEFILPEKLEPRSSVYPRNPSIVDNEAHFMYAPEFSEFVVQYITASANGEYVNIRRNEGVQVKPFVTQINSVQDLSYIAVSILDKTGNDDIEDFADHIIYETGEKPADNSGFSKSIAKMLANEMANNMPRRANSTLLGKSDTVNRGILSFCLVLRELLDTSDEEPKKILNNVNQSLNHCKLAWLNPHNPLDLLLLGSIYTKSPLSYIKAYLLYMMPNI